MIRIDALRRIALMQHACAGRNGAFMPLERFPMGRKVGEGDAITILVRCAKPKPATAIGFWDKTVVKSSCQTARSRRAHILAGDDARIDGFPCLASSNPGHHDLRYAEAHRCCGIASAASEDGLHLGRG